MYDFQLNIFAIIILLSLLVVIYISRDTINIKSKIFTIMIYSTIFMNVCEILSWKFDTLPGASNYFFNFLFNFLFTGLATVVVGLWGYYIDYIVYSNEEKHKNRWHYFLPTIIMGVLSVLNIFYPILFKISADNVYSRLPMIWSSIILTVIIYIFVLLFVIKKASKSNKSVILGVLIFLALPIIASVGQLLYIGLHIIWPTTAVALLITYLIFETTDNARDYLTGLFTRERAEDQISRYILKNKNFSVIMIDIDDFKQLNDTYGHHRGDQVLIEVAKILKEIFDKHSLVSRFGGDEFLIVSNLDDNEALDIQRNRINYLIKKSDIEYFRDIKLSFGTTICVDTTKCDADKIIIQADNNMYKNKANLKKEAKRD